MPTPTNAEMQVHLQNFIEIGVFVNTVHWPTIPTDIATELLASTRGYGITDYFPPEAQARLRAAMLSSTLALHASSAPVPGIDRLAVAAVASALAVKADSLADALSIMYTVKTQEDLMDMTQLVLETHESYPFANNQVAYDTFLQIFTLRARPDQAVNNRPESDAARYIARALRTYERLLTGIPDEYAHVVVLGGKGLAEVFVDILRRRYGGTDRDM